HLRLSHVGPGPPGGRRQAHVGGPGRNPRALNPIRCDPYRPGDLGPGRWPDAGRPSDDRHHHRPAPDQGRIRGVSLAMPDQPTPPPSPRRDPMGHKGTFGTVVVIGGCAGNDRHMVGAPALTATAALRAGAGLARLVMPAPVLDAGITICPSATGI